MNYLIVGQEHYLVKKEMMKIESELKEYEKTIFDASLKTFKLAQVIHQASTISFFNPSQLIIVQNAVFLKSKGKLETDEVKQLEAYLKKPNPDVTLLFLLYLDEKENIDTRKKAYKLLVDYGSYQSFDKLKPHAYEHYISDLIKQKNLNFTLSVRNLVMRRLPRDLSSADAELDKLALYPEVLDEGLIDKLLPPHYDDKLFDLIHHIIQRNEALAMRLFYDLIKLNHEPIALVYALSSQFRFMYRIKVLTNQGKTQQDITKLLSQNPYYIENTIKQARLVDIHRLLGILNDLAELDIQFKSDSSINRELSLSLFMLKELGLCSR